MRDPAPALDALPLPLGDPTGLWRAAGWLRVAAEHVGGTPLATTRSLPAGVADGWSGFAAQEAATEAAIIGSRSAALSDRLTRAASVLSEYGDALDAAQRVTVGLQQAYDDGWPHGASGSDGPPGAEFPGADSPGPAASTALGDPTGLADLTALAGRYAVAMADLDLAGSVAAHRLRALAAEVGDGPVGRGGQQGAVPESERALDPDPRGAAFAGLTIVVAAQHRDEAEHVADEVVDVLATVSAGDPWATGTAAALLGTWARDPVFAQALWSRLPPEELAKTLAAVAAPSSAQGRPSAVSAEWRQERGLALVQGLGGALAVAANPAYAMGVDPVTAARFDAWRSAWLGRLSVETGEVVRRPDGTTVGGAWVQGQLLAAATTAGLTPGALYATTVGVAIVRADVRAGSSGRTTTSPATATTAVTAEATALLAPDGRSLAVPGLPPDPVRSLTESLMSDTAAARAWLLHPLPEAPDRMVVDHLVDTRYLDLDPVAGAAALAAVGRLVVVAGSNPRSREATLVTGAFLDAVGRTAVSSPQPTRFSRALGPALGDLGSLLGAHPDALTATLDGSAAPGTDALALSPADRLVRHGRDAGTWEVVLADRSRAAALLGALALDGSTPLTPSTASAASTARDPASAPALARAMGGIGDVLERDLVAAVAAHPTGAGTEAIEAAARRLGSTTGFVLTSAGAVLTLQGADRDSEHARLAELADLAIGKITVPGAAGRLATPVVRAAADQLVATALPTGAEAAQRSATSAAVAGRREEALTAVRTLVSRAQPWTPEQAPQQWAARTASTRSPAPFWDAAGVPLPEPEMTTAQRRSFTDWRRDEGLAVYDTVPQVVRDAIGSGVLDATSSPAPATR